MILFHPEEMRLENRCQAENYTFQPALRLLDDLTEFWPMDEGGSNIYHFQARALKTSLAILHISFSLRELSLTKLF